MNNGGMAMIVCKVSLQKERKSCLAKPVNILPLSSWEPLEVSDDDLAMMFGRVDLGIDDGGSGSPCCTRRTWTTI